VPRGDATAAALRALALRVRPYAPALAWSALLGTISVRAIVSGAGEPAVPLDDAFIHLQYARRLAEGSFFGYVEGGGYTTGATSLLWPILLAPFYKLGFRGLSLIYVTWILGALAHAALTVETARVTFRLAGRTAAVGAGAMCAVFGAFAWFAWSGMETVPFAWILMRTARIGAAACDAPATSTTAAARAPGSRGELIALGLVAPLLRPEGALASLMAAVALARSAGFGRSGDLVQPTVATRLRSLIALAPLAGPLIPPLLHLALTGQTASSTAAVKWLALSPYYDRGDLVRVWVSNTEMLLTDLLNGGDWSAIFLPEGSIAPILLGLVALPIAGVRRRAPMLAIFVVAIGLGALLPCTYLSLLWNRLRYIWPFAPAYFVMLACLAREAGDLLRRVNPSITFATPLLCGVVIGALASRLPWTVRDLAQSSAAIAGQQVTLARWAADHLPESARIGVNDTGAIAYLSGRTTFDVVGLTTVGEARYWVAGAGSRFEHYEKAPREALPTHFIVYPHWMACPAVLGDELKQATVLDQTILGGATMIAYEARYDLLGSGEAPVVPPPSGALADAIDVADLESEAAHEYALGDAADHENQAVMLAAPAPAFRRPDEAGSPHAPRGVIADGGRFHRARDAFTARLSPGAPAVIVMRVAADAPITLAISVAGREVGRVEVPAGPWVERAVELPGSSISASTPLTIEARSPRASTEPARFHAFHYWLYAM
jgi:hypothetical protein